MALSSIGKRLHCVAFYLIALVAVSEAVLLNVHQQQMSELFIADAESSFNGVREKRATKASDVEVSPLATAVHLNNSHLHLMVHWAGQGSPVVFCLGRDQVQLIFIA